MNKCTKQSNCYTASTNGYVRIYIPATSATAEIYGFDKIANRDFMICNLHGNNSNSSFYSIYIKKKYIASIKYLQMHIRNPIYSYISQH